MNAHIHAHITRARAHTTFFLPYSLSPESHYLYLSLTGWKGELGVDCVDAERDGEKDRA